MKRREVLIGLGASGLAALLRPFRARAQGAAPEGTEASDDGEPEYLFVQNGTDVELAAGKLKIGGVAASTLFFSDRPERITGHTPTDYFVDHWGSGEDNFAENPPNAALSILSDLEVEDAVVVLRNPTLTDGDLHYDVEVLEGPETVSGSGALFIDMIGRPLSPNSVAGVHRRHRRRRRRRALRR